MAFVRYIALAALVIWLGGMVVLGFLVAPATFRVLGVAAPTVGGFLAGAVFGEVLRRFHLLAYGCGAVMMVCLFAMKFVGPPPRSFPLRAGIVAAMLAVAGYSGIVVSGEMAKLQSSISGPVNALPEHDARRVRFTSLHQRATALMALNLAGGLVLLAWYVKE